MTIKFFEESTEKPWLVEYRHIWTGKRLKKWFSSEEAAREFDQAQEEQRVTERAILRKKRKTQQGETRITVKELLDKYFELVVENPTTLRTQKEHVTPILGAFGSRLASLISHDDILNFILAQKRRGLKQSTISTRVRIFRRAISWAKKTGILKNNPLADLVLPQAKSKRIAPPSPKEAETLMTWAAPHVQRVIILGWHTGARIGPSELFRLTWADIDLEYGIFRMPSAKKNKSSADARDIPIGNILLPIIRKWWEYDSERGIEFVINWHGRPVKSINKSWQRCLELAKIRRPIRPYDLRHAYATYSVQAGVKLKIIADIMDHSDPSMILKTYQYTDERDRREAIEAMPDHLRLAVTKDDIPGIARQKSISRPG